jgi:ABC-type dipeptide/oligopeptide/nickel transport system permease subunit
MRDYVESARADPVPISFTIVRVHVPGKCAGADFVYATSPDCGVNDLASGLSFLGLGVNAGAREWGLMLNTLRTAILHPTPG